MGCVRVKCLITIAVHERHAQRQCMWLAVSGHSQSHGKEPLLLMITLNRDRLCSEEHVSSPFTVQRAPRGSYDAYQEGGNVPVCVILECADREVVKWAVQARVELSLIGEAPTIYNVTLTVSTKYLIRTWKCKMCVFSKFDCLLWWLRLRWY